VSDVDTAGGDEGGPRHAVDLLDQNEAEGTLLAAWNSGRMPHAWLIGGPSGVGKATLAYRLARFVLVRGAEETSGLFSAATAPATSLRVSPDHPVFRRVAAGGHADLLVIERRRDEKKGRLKRDIAVDDVRRAAPFLRRTAAEGGWRVAIIDGADRMNSNGLNAVLKILEEPPQRALLLLVSDNPGGTLPTIRSRCRKLNLHPLPDETIIKLLEEKRSSVPDEDRPVLARLAGGGIGRAIDLADAGGVGLYRAMIETLGRPKFDVVAIDGLAERAVRDDATYETTTELLIWWLARLIRETARGRRPEPLFAEEAEVIERALASRGLDRWMEVWEKTVRLFASAEYGNLDRKLIVSSALAGAATSAA